MDNGRLWVPPYGECYAWDSRFLCRPARRYNEKRLNYAHDGGDLLTAFQLNKSLVWTESNIAMSCIGKERYTAATERPNRYHAGLLMPPPSWISHPLSVCYAVAS